MEYAITALILMAAAWMLVRRVINALRSKGAPTCGCGGSCGLSCPGCPAPRGFENNRTRPGE